MVTTTRAQREALLRVFNRHSTQPMSYLDFRRLALPTWGMDGAIVIPWCGMYLVIEADGYTHS